MLRSGDGRAFAAAGILGIDRVSGVSVISCSSSLAESRLCSHRTHVDHRIGLKIPFVAPAPCCTLGLVVGSTGETQVSRHHALLCTNVAQAKRAPFSISIPAICVSLPLQPGFHWYFRIEMDSPICFPVLSTFSLLPLRPGTQHTNKQQKCVRKHNIITTCTQQCSIAVRGGLTTTCGISRKWRAALSILLNELTN